MADSDTRLAGWLPIDSAPKDRSVLLFVEDSVIEASFIEQVDIAGERYGDGYWLPVSLSTHGCGCCASELERPVAWMPLPPRPQVQHD